MRGIHYNAFKLVNEKSPELCDSSCVYSTAGKLFPRCEQGSLEKSRTKILKFWMAGWPQGLGKEGGGVTFKYYKVRTPRSCNWVPNLGHCMYLFDLEPDLKRVPHGSKWVPLGFQILATVYVYSIWNPTSRGFQTVPNGFQILATVYVSSIWNPTSKGFQVGSNCGTSLALAWHCVCHNVWHVQAGMRERIVIPV